MCYNDLDVELLLDRRTLQIGGVQVDLGDCVEEEDLSYRFDKGRLSITFEPSSRPVIERNLPAAAKDLPRTRCTRWTAIPCLRAILAGTVCPDSPWRLLRGDASMLHLLVRMAWAPPSSVYRLRMAHWVPSLSLVHLLRNQQHTVPLAPTDLHGLSGGISRQYSCRSASTMAGRSYTREHS